MTALCGGGTSGPKTGAAAVVDYSSGLIASILAFRNLGWLIPVIPLAGLPPLILSSFCATDPPAMPTFTSAETNAILQLEFGSDFDSGISKLGDLILHSIWYDICQCTSGSLTAYPTVTPPAGTPIFQPPLPPSNTPCAVQIHNLSKTLPINRSIIADSLHFLGLQPTLLRCVASNTLVTSPGFPVRVDWSIVNEAHTTVMFTTHANLNPGQSVDFNVAMPAGAGYVEVDYNDDLTGGNAAGTGSGASRLDSRFELWCGAIPGTSQQACCPPDTATQASLDLILKMVTLIQRQAVPFSYLPSTTHPTLSGAGSFDISGLIGASIQVTTLPTPIGREGSAPTEYFDMGFITFGTPDGYPQSYRLERDNQVMFPARCGLFTTLAYDLHPGVVVTITELVREP
jgi:hypothetical protein